MALGYRLLCALCLVALLILPAAADSGHGSLFITTLPPNAAVWLDGNYLGDTPLYVDSISVGRHSLTLTHSGWLPQSTYAEVMVGQVATISVVLTQNSNGNRHGTAAVKGSLIVRGAGTAKMYLDGAPVSSLSEPVPVAAGQHILTVSKSATDRSIRVVRIYPQVTTVVALTPVNPTTAAQSDDVLVSLADYVPDNNFSISGSDIAVHYHGAELECAIGSRTYVLNGRPGQLTIAPAMVGNKVYLPLSLVTRIGGQSKQSAH